MDKKKVQYGVKKKAPSAGVNSSMHEKKGQYRKDEVKKRADEQKDAKKKKSTNS